MTDPASSPFADIRELIASAPDLDADARDAAQSRVAGLVQSRGSLGRLEDLAVWLASWQGLSPPQINQPMAVIFAGSHGVARHNVAADPPETTPKIVDLLRKGDAATNHITAAAGAALRVFEMALEQATPDITQAPAMSEAECAATIAFGMEAVAEKPDLLALGELGVGGGTTAAAVACGLFGGDAGYWVRAGNWVTPDVLARRVEAVETALQTHRGHMSDPLEVMRRLGGRELAAMVGAIVAARHQRVPVVLDGFATCVAAAIVQAVSPSGADHCLAGHLSAEPAHQALLDRLGKDPLLSLDLRHCEAAGSSLAIPILKAAC
ncbi:MAG: nicotinate-nucleotide--dimethylbenzimidazole phosphoribosyltransferase, partial [Pseudomonadota bacterium]